MAQLMLLNPAKRPTKRRKASPAQLRALAAGRRARAVATNPAPRKRRKLRAASTAHTKRRRVRRNPISTGGLMAQIMSAAQGAAGALAVDAVVTYIPFPTSMTTGTMKHITKAGLAIALGLVGKKFLGRAAGRMAEGALTVTAYSAAKEALAGVGMNLSGMGYVSPARQFQAALPAPGMAEYVNNFRQGQNVGEYVNYGGSGY